MVRSYSSRRRTRPQAAGDLLKSILGVYRLDKKLDQYNAFSRWEEVVGPEIAQIARPERISKNSVLVIRVVDPVWAQELEMRKLELLEKLRALGTGAHFEDIRFVSGGPESTKKIRDRSRNRKET